MLELGLGIYDVTKALVFGKRNVDKASNGDFVRGAVAMGQTRNAIVAASTMNNCVGKSAKYCLNGLDAAAKGCGLGGFAAKTALVASDYINPLICVSGAVKVAMAKDKKTEAINQAGSLGGMFLFERIAKTFLTSKGRKEFLKTDYAKKEFGKKAVKAMRTVDAINVLGGKYSKHIKYGIPITKGLTFVGMSIAGYALGSLLSKKINELLKETKPKNKPNIIPQRALAGGKTQKPTTQQRPTMASLTGVKPVTPKEIKSVMSYNA